MVSGTCSLLSTFQLNRFCHCKRASSYSCVVSVYSFFGDHSVYLYMIIHTYVYQTNICYLLIYIHIHSDSFGVDV